jgi:hypothetical protein
MRIGATFLERTRQVMEVEGLTVSHEQPLAVTLRKGTVGIEAEVRALDSLGIALRRLTVWGGDGDTDLQALADAIAQRVTYLPERLAPIERDPERGIVQMRSAPPLTEGEDVEYYEATLTREDSVSRIRLARYRWSAERRRRTDVSIVLTQQLFQRLVDDLATLLCCPDAAD